MGSKVASVVMTFVLLGMWSAGPSFAQGMEDMPGDQPMEHKGMMMGPGGQGKAKMGMQAMRLMMKDMLKKTVIATSDGGVVVMVGNKLIKYDKDLNLVKEAEIKVDMEAMRKEMMDMMKNCPMMKERMQGQGMDAKAPGMEAMEPPQPADSNPPAAAAEEKVEPKAEEPAGQK